MRLLLPCEAAGETRSCRLRYPSLAAKSALERLTCIFLIVIAAKQLVCIGPLVELKIGLKLIKRCLYHLSKNVYLHTVIGQQCHIESS